MATKAFKLNRTKSPPVNFMLTAFPDISSNATDVPRIEHWIFDPGSRRCRPVQATSQPIYLVKKFKEY